MAKLKPFFWAMIKMGCSDGFWQFLDNIGQNEYIRAASFCPHHKWKQNYYHCKGDRHHFLSLIFTNKIVSDDRSSLLCWQERTARCPREEFHNSGIPRSGRTSQGHDLGEVGHARWRIWRWKTLRRLWWWSCSKLGRRWDKKLLSHANTYFSYGKLWICLGPKENLQSKFQQRSFWWSIILVN